MISSVAAVLLLAAPVKVAVPDFTIAGLDPVIARAYAEHFVTILGESGQLQLTTSRDIQQILGLERQRQLLGCSAGQTSCLAELAGALGVDAILTVALTKGGSTVTANVRVVKATDGSEITSLSDRLPNEEALQDWFDAQAPILTVKVARAFGLAPVARSSAVRWVPAIAGAALAVGGGALVGLAYAKAGDIQSGKLTTPQIRAAAADGRTFEAAGFALIGTGAAAIATSLVWVAVAPSSSVRVVVAPMSDGAAAVLGGTF